MRADDRAERGRDLDLSVRAQVTDQLLERRHALLRLGVCDPDPQPGLVARSGPERLCELLDRLAVPPHPLEGQHLSVFEREDRLDVEELAGPARGSADPAAPREELERVEGEDEAGFTLEALDELVDLLVGGPALEPPLNREREHGDRRGGGLVSITRTRSPVSEAACRALSYVPESLAETLSAKIRS